jgi:hypothetical protein
VFCADVIDGPAITRLIRENMPISPVHLRWPCGSIAAIEDDVLGLKVLSASQRIMMLEVPESEQALGIRTMIS